MVIFTESVVVFGTSVNCILGSRSKLASTLAPSENAILALLDDVELVEAMGAVGGIHLVVTGDHPYAVHRHRLVVVEGYGLPDTVSIHVPGRGVLAVHRVPQIVAYGVAAGVGSGGGSIRRRNGGRCYTRRADGLRDARSGRARRGGHVIHGDVGLTP